MAVRVSGLAVVLRVWVSACECKSGFGFRLEPHVADTARIHPHTQRMDSRCWKMLCMFPTGGMNNGNNGGGLNGIGAGGGINGMGVLGGGMPAMGGMNNMNNMGGQAIGGHSVLSNIQSLPGNSPAVFNLGTSHSFGNQAMGTSSNMGVSMSGLHPKPETLNGIGVFSEECSLCHRTLRWKPEAIETEAGLKAYKGGREEPFGGAGMLL